MRKITKIIPLVIVAAIVAVLLLKNNAKAYSVTLYSTAGSVAPGETFSVVLDLHESTPLINVTVTYDTNLFSYAGGTAADSVNSADDGAIEILNQSSAIQSLTLNFTAKDVSAESTGTFSVSGDIAVVTEDNTRLGRSNIEDGSTFSCGVTVSPNGESGQTDPGGDPSNPGEPSDPEDPEDPDIPDLPDIPIEPGAPVITPAGNVVLKVGETTQKYVDQTDAIWVSSDETVATVVGGSIRAKQKGVAIVTVSVDSRNSSFYVTVQDADKKGGNQGGSEEGGQGGSEQGGNEQGGGSESGGQSGQNQNNNKGKSKGGSSANTNKNTVTPTGSNNTTSTDSVPATGESSMETIAVLAIVTLIVAAIIFRRKIKM